MVTITDWNDLDAVRNDLTASYTLANDLDSSTAGYTGIGDDFTPIGVGQPGPNGNFLGEFDGQGYAIKDLVVSLDANSVGLFGLVGDDPDKTPIIENLSVFGSVTNTGNEQNTGGFVGQFAEPAEIRNCASHVDVTGTGDNVGGLVGFGTATITDSYATGSVDGEAEVGGLSGYNFTTGIITNCYATGAVTADTTVGGLVGDNTGGVIRTSYAVGNVTANTTVGALVGNHSNGDELSDSYADEQTTGQTSLTGSTGGPTTNSYTLTTSEMQGDEAPNTGNMDGFDFTNVWDTVLTEDSDTSADGYPILLAVDRQNQLEAQGVGLVIASESGQVSAIATGSGTETTSATETGGVGATATPLSIETGRATEAGATAATASPVSTETTAFIESGSATATATSAGIETARATETGSPTALATPDVTATGRIGESGTATALATPNVIENVGVAEVGSASAIATPDVIETGRTFTPESGTVTATSSLTTTETASAIETGAVGTQATPLVIESATSSIVRVAPRRTLDKQLRAIGRVLDLDES